MDVQRIVGAVCIGLTGLGLLLVAGLQVQTGVVGPVGLTLVGVTAVLGVAFIAVGPIAFRSDLESRYLLRIAGWNVLGVVATVLVLALVFQYQTATGGNVSAPLLSGGVVVGVSAFAHVLIGFNDVRRIRAQVVAKQRQKAAVMNRFVRHNLRHTAQILMGYGDYLVRDTGYPAPDRTTFGERIAEIGTELSETHTQISVLDDLLDRDDPTRTVELREVLSAVADDRQERYAGATVELDLPASLPARAGDHVETALRELVDNAFRHGGSPPQVSIHGAQVDGVVQIDISDNGDGIPDYERALITDGEIETQLNHSSGLGLWLAKWIVEQYEGSLSIRDRDDGDGAAVTVRLPAAA